MKNMKIVMMAFIVALGLLSFTKPSHDNTLQKESISSKKGYEVGDEATDFKLKNIDGKMVSLSDFKSAKGFIVIFTCNHCPYAKI
jgi:cytochrome oxidase Cu insertion factor (SCO1/SenC/PrrC family)